MVFPRIKYFDTFISWHLVFFKQIRNLRILFGNIWCFEDWTNLKFCLTSKKARYQRINLNFLFFSFFLAFLKSKKIRFPWRNPRKSGNPISLKKSKEIRFPWRNPTNIISRITFCSDFRILANKNKFNTFLAILLESYE